MCIGGCIFEPPTEPIEEITVTLETGGTGTVTGFPESGTVRKGDTLTLFAEAGAGAFFSGWQLERFIADNPLVVAVDEPLTVRAIFVQRPEGMVAIAARDSTFTMGTDERQAAPYERPAHTVRFGYNYFMSACEVTIGEYRSLVTESGGAYPDDGSADSLPVTYVSWYDAVLYCNQLSKSRGYDTVYSYTDRCAATEECPYVLENFAIHYDRFGYRLPTEAEWEYACRAGSNTTYFWGNDTGDIDKYAWYFRNGEDRSHPVGRKAPNAFGLYDITGNVAEWVNDWLEFYADSSYTDPVGPVHLTQEQFEDRYERPLRGGTYRLNAQMARSSARKGQYELFGSPTVDIGFRVAMGAFEAPKSAPEVVIPDSLDATIACNKSDLIDLVGTNLMKLVFVYAPGKNRFCALVDFSRSPVTIVKCGDDSTVMAPTISPDGRYIAYSSKGEGDKGTGTITVRSLEGSFPIVSQTSGFLPRWWVDTLTRDTFLVYTDGASQNDLAVWYTEKTLQRKITAGELAGSEEVLWGIGSYHGGLSSDGRFLGTAYTRAKVVDLFVKDTNLHYFVPPYNGQTDTPQVCNFSMSPSKAEPGEALFLDFGSPGVSTLLDRSYDSHEVLFIANSRLLSWEHVSAWFEPPEGYYQWNYTEWTNYRGAIVGVAKTTAEEEDAVILLNRDNADYCTLLKGKNLRDVAAWIDPSVVSEIADPWLDFGKYDLPPQTNGQEALAKKLSLFWHERDRVSCVAIGNSPMYFGFDPHSISLPTVNMAWFQSSLSASIVVAQRYILPHTKNLETLIIDLDASYLYGNALTGRPPVTGLIESKGYLLDAANDFYREGLPQEVVDRINGFTSDVWAGFDSGGAFIDSVIGSGWGDAVVEGYDYSLDDSIVQMNLSWLEELIDSAAARGVNVLAVNFPQNPGYKTATMVGKDGPSHFTFQRLVARLHEMEQQASNFYFYDANNGGDHDYTDSEAMDTNHLNSRGGRKLAARVDSLLQIVFE